MKKNILYLSKTTLALLAALSLSVGISGCGTSTENGTTTSGSDTTEENNTSSEAETTKENSNDTSNTEATDESSSSDEKKTASKGADYQTQAPGKGDTIVTISYKDYGDVKIKMFPEEAPLAVENFTTHAKNGYYDNLTMHRVINDFMIQGGDPSGDGTGGDSIWGKEFKNETVEYLNPIRGSLCMANAGPDTNSSQFFIVQAKSIDESALEPLSDIQKEMYRTNNGCPWLTGGYTVFGQVYEGIDVVDAIAAVETDTNDKPAQDVVIDHISVETYDN